MEQQTPPDPIVHLNKIIRSLFTDRIVDWREECLSKNLFFFAQTVMPCFTGGRNPGPVIVPQVVPGTGMGRWQEGRRLAPGELGSGVSQWAHRQSELLDRRLYMKDFWYAAGMATR